MCKSQELEGFWVFQYTTCFVIESEQSNTTQLEHNGTFISPQTLMPEDH